MPMDNQATVKQQKETVLQETYQFLATLERGERKFGLMERLYLSQLAFTTGEINAVKQEALRIAKAGYEVRYGILDETTKTAYDSLIYGSTLTKRKLEDFLQKRTAYQTCIWKLDQLNQSYQQNANKNTSIDIFLAECILMEIAPLIKEIQALKTEADQIFSELSEDIHFPQAVYQYLKQADILAQNIGLPDFPLDAAVKAKLLLSQSPEMDASQAFQQAQAEKAYQENSLPPIPTTPPTPAIPATPITPAKEERSDK